MGYFIRLLASSLALLLTYPAAAVEHIATYTGVVNMGYDLTGVFGTANSVLDGKEFSLTFTVTTPAPGALVRSDSVINRIRSGSQYGIPSSVSAIMTIGEYSMSISGDWYGEADRVNDSLRDDGTELDVVYHWAAGSQDMNGGRRSSYAQVALVSWVNEIIDSSYLAAPLNYNVRPGESGQARAHLYESDANGQETIRTWANLDVRHVLIQPTAVPEPSTWAMLVFAFGLLGNAMRRHERVMGQVMSPRHV